MTKNLSNIYGDPCANKWGVRKNFLYNLLELEKLNFYVTHEVTCTCYRPS